MRKINLNPDKVTVKIGDLELPVLEETPLDLLPLDPRVKAFAKATGAKFIFLNDAPAPESVTEMMMLVQARGMYHALRDHIIINRGAHQRSLLSGYFGTLEEMVLHELVHWAGHPSRANREFMAESIRSADMPIPPEDRERVYRARCKEEVTAQMGMHGLAFFLGLDIDLYDKLLLDYIKQFKDVDTSEAYEDAKKAVKFFFETLGLERFANREYDLKGK